MPPRYAAHLDEPILQRIGIRVGDTTLRVAFTGLRKSPDGGYVSHYELIIKRKGGEYWYKVKGIWNPFGKARITANDMIESFERFLRRVKNVNHSTCPVCRGLKLSGVAIDNLMDHLQYNEYTVL
jgi:hypothetical protein